MLSPKQSMMGTLREGTGCGWAAYKGRERMSAVIRVARQDFLGADMSVMGWARNRRSFDFV
jgi:hypothetical protein